MTGRDLILHILMNGLEDKPIYEDGKILGFLTAKEAAEKINVGLAWRFSNYRHDIQRKGD